MAINVIVTRRMPHDTVSTEFKKRGPRFGCPSFVWVDGGTLAAIKHDACMIGWLAALDVE